MKRFEKILFISDGKTEREEALERAVNISKRNQALLTVVEVLEDLPKEMQSSLKSTDAGGLDKIAAQESAERLDNLIAPIKGEGVQVTSKILLGTSFIEIIREVLRNNHDLVMLSPRKKPKLREMLFGSRIMHLMRKCPCPAWAIKQTKRKQYARILAAVDPVPSDDERNAFNINILEIAASLSQSERSELHVVHCWSLPLEKRLKSRPALLQSEIDKLVRESRKAHKRGLDQLLERSNLEDLQIKVHLLKGEPDELIAELARKKWVELVVMGTVCTTGVAGLFIGNTAEKTLAQVDCSVLALKPDRFLSPVNADKS